MYVLSHGCARATPCPPTCFVTIYAQFKPGETVFPTSRLQRAARVQPTLRVQSQLASHLSRYFGCFALPRIALNHPANSQHYVCTHGAGRYGSVDVVTLL